jgi:hypothetical protein
MEEEEEDDDEEEEEEVQVKLRQSTSLRFVTVSPTEARSTPFEHIYEGLPLN